MNFDWGKALLSQIQQLGLTPRCPMCERPASDVFCLDCGHQLQGCQIPTTPTVQHNGLPVLAWGKYTGFLKQALAQLKYRQKPEIAQFLGQKLGLAWLATQPQDHHPIVVPIPLHQAREQQRGYNQATLLANSFCHVTGLTLVSKGLVRVRATEAQFHLTSQERFANVAQAFRLGPNFARQTHKKPILLLDDIYTTGATVCSAAQTLRTVGLQISGVAVVAKA